MTTWFPRAAPEHLLELLAGTVTKSKLSNLRPSAALLKLCQVVAEKFEAADVGIWQLRNLVDVDKATGTDLDAIGEAVLPEGQTREGASKGTSLITLTRPTTVGIVPIPSGTVVAQDTVNGRMFYSTTAAGQWNNGQATCAPIAIQAQVEGSGSSAIVGAINIMISNLTVSSVTNTAACTGQDEESDAQYRQRIKDYVRSLPRCNPSAQMAAVRKVENSDGSKVRFAKDAQDPDSLSRGLIYIDDGRGTAGTFETVAGETLVANAAGGERLLYTSRRPWKSKPTVTKSGTLLVEGIDYTVVAPWGQIRLAAALSASQNVVVGAYDVYTGLVAAAQKVIDGDQADPTNFPGGRANGTVVTVLPAAVVPATVIGSLVVEANYDRTAVQRAAQTAILEYINAIDIGGPRYASRTIERAMSVAGALRFTLAINSDVYVQEHEVQRATASDVVIS